MGIELVTGITMVKDEADIVALTIRHMISQVDALIVLDNGSTDETPEILAAYSEVARVAVIRDPEVAYYQSQKMTKLAHIARELGAAWVVPFDADEFWVSPHGRIADVLRADSTNLVMRAPIYNHIATPDTPPAGVPLWRFREPGPLPKVACRTSEQLVIHQGNHSVQYGDKHITGEDGVLQVHHFPYRSPEQMVRKARNGARAYAATDLPEDIGKHWREYGQRSDEEIRSIFYEWFYEEHPEDREDLVRDLVLAQGLAYVDRDLSQWGPVKLPTSRLQSFG